MGKILVLSSQVANQIAAGEVVERPASVIKELVENSLDAGANNIEVRVRDGGLGYIVVQDDGCGMDESDVALATKRFATSKLKTAEDLFSLRSFGFRGEALPSIAAIANLSIISRPRDQEYATKAILHGGEISDLGRAAGPLGTRIEVRDLFFNVPARLKFIKSKRSEIVTIDRMLRAYAFVYPNCAWQFFSDEALIFKSEVAREERAIALLGNDSKGFIHDFSAKTDLLEINGVIVAPMLARRDLRGINIFLNNRLVNDRKLIAAIKVSFRTLLEIGKNPAVALNIKISPDEVDINVHPQKAELRFKNEQRVMSHIIRLLGDFLATTPWLKKYSEIEPTQSFEPINFTNGEIPAYRSSALDFKLITPLALMPSRRFSDLKVLGQVQTTYLMLESHEGLVVVDQHAAHERVRFEKIRKDLQHNLVSQSLLVPISLELKAAELALVLDHSDELYRLGIEVEALGDNSIVIRALPDFIKSEDARALFFDVLAELSNFGRSDSMALLYDNVCATLACHSSVRAGQRLSIDEIGALLKELDSIEYNAHCPHGRPVVKSFAESEMKKWFHRT